MSLQRIILATSLMLMAEFELDGALARSDKEPCEALLEESAVRSEMSGNGMSHLWPMMVDTRHLWKKVEEGRPGSSKL